MDFKDFQKGLKDVKYLKYRTEKDWEIFLPYNIPIEKFQAVIVKCRELLQTKWHVVFTEPTSEIPEPEIKMWWELDKC